MNRSHSLASLEIDMLRGRGVAWITRLNVERHQQRFGRWGRPCSLTNNSYYCDGQDLGVVFDWRLARSVDHLRVEHAGSGEAFTVNDEGYLVAVGAGGSLAAPAWGTAVVIDGFPYSWGLPIARDDAQLHGPIMTSTPGATVGLTNSFRMGDLALSGVITAQVGGKVVDRGMQSRYSSGNHPDLDQSVRPEAKRKPVTYYTRLAQYDEHFVRSAGHAALEEISLSYRFGRGSMILRGLPGSAELSVTGRNLAVLGSQPGYHAIRRGIEPFSNAHSPTRRELWVRMSVGI
jgi:hypothetical protein